MIGLSVFVVCNCGSVGRTLQKMEPKKEKNKDVQKEKKNRKNSNN